MLEKYNTVSGEGVAEIVEKKSRFIAHTKPIENEKDALEYIEAINKKYWDARHNVYAYQLGERNEIQRYSDDGEPGGTAGMPVLEVLRGGDIKDTIVVVTRYFGGTLLGTGGLVRAYTKAAQEGIAAAVPIEKVLYKTISVKTDYGYSGKVQYEIMNGRNVLENTLYTDEVEFIVLTEMNFVDEFLKNIVNVTNGQAVVTIGEEVYKDKEVN